MRTSLTHGNAGTESAADRMTAQLLAARHALPTAANNRPPVPSSRRAAYLRNEMLADRMKPLHAILDYVDADLADGVPVSEHLAWIDQLRAEVEVRAVAEFTRRVDHPLPVLIQREAIAETVAQGKADASQARVMVEPGNPDALESFIKHAAHHRKALHVLETKCRQQLALVRGGGRRVYGARPQMQVAR